LHPFPLLLYGEGMGPLGACVAACYNRRSGPSSRDPDSSGWKNGLMLTQKPGPQPQWLRAGSSLVQAKAKF
jgi:hypothetical protein